MVRRALAASRFLVLAAVFGSFVGAVAVLAYGAAASVGLAVEAFSSGAPVVKHAKALAVSYIELIDVFLLGTVLYIVSLGLYELFIDDKLPTPDWLVIGSLDDLKELVLRVIAVMLGVYFVGHVALWDGSARILELGIAVALVLAALALLIGTVPVPHRGTKEPGDGTGRG